MTTDEYRNILREEFDQHFYDQPISQQEWQKRYDDAVEKLFSYMEDKNREHGIFETPKNKTSHSHFWEVLIGNILLDAGHEVKKDTRDAAPDYFFTINSLKIHIEAKAPTEGNKEELKPTGIIMHKAMDLLKEDSFELGYITGDNSILRFTSILKDVIAQIENFEARGTITKKDKVIIAINGNDVVKNKEFHKEDIKTGLTSCGFHMLCALYGLSGKELYDPKENVFFYEKGPVYKGDTPIYGGCFCENNITPIDGIIYSNINKSSYLQGNQPFLFFPNPAKEDLSRYFPFCRNMKKPVEEV